MFVDSTVPQTSPLKSGLTPFSEEEDEKATVAGIVEPNNNQEIEKPRNDSKIQNVNDHNKLEESKEESDEQPSKFIETRNSRLSPKQTSPF